MDCPPAALPHDEPLVETCMLWLEDRVHDVDHSGMREAVAAFRQQHPASWQPHVQSRTLPSRAFRNALRAEVRTQQYGGGIDSDSCSDEGQLSVEPACEATAPARVLPDATQAVARAPYCPPHRRPGAAAQRASPLPTRILPPRANRGTPASSPYWAGTAAQSAAPRGSRR